MLFRNAKQPSYVLYMSQSLTDIERFCTSKSAPSSYRSILAIDTTFNIGQHYVAQMAYQNPSLLRKDTLTSTWFPRPVLIHRHQEKRDFSYLWQAVKRGDGLLKDLAIIRTDEYRELFDGILDETQANTGHLLGKEHVLKNTQKKLEQLSFPSRQIKWIVNDILGNPFVQEKEGLIQSESQEEFNNRYKKLKNMWIEIEKNYTVRNGENFVTYFGKFKLVEIKEKMSRYAQRNLRQSSTDKITSNR